MADLGTRYLGFNLPHPFVPGASPLADDLDSVRRLEDAGAPMVTVRSLIAAPLDPVEETRRFNGGQHSSQVRALFAGLHEPPRHARDPHAYCEHIRRIRKTVSPDVPVVASLYARWKKQWLSCSKLIQDAGADAVELNIYGMLIEPDDSWQPIQEQIVETVRLLRGQLRIPIAVKLLPFYKTFDLFVRKLPGVGADGLILFNGFHQADLAMAPLHDPFLRALSTPQDPFCRFHWLSRLSGRVGSDLAFSGGAGHTLHAIKAVLCGAAVVQIVSLFMKHGIELLQTLRNEMNSWLDEHEYESLDQLQGQVSVKSFDSLDAFELAYNRQILLKPN